MDKPLQGDEQVQQLLRPLAAVLDRQDVTEITINKPEEVWAKDKQGWQVLAMPELTETYLQALATALIVFNGLQLRVSGRIERKCTLRNHFTKLRCYS